MHADRVEYSIVVPVYDSTESLPELAERIDRVFAVRLKAPYELILVDDRSPNPETWPIMEQLANRYASVRSIQLTRNFGKTAAVLCGFQQSRGDWVIAMDDDLQHAPEDISALVTDNCHDVSVAQFDDPKHSLPVRISSRIKGWFENRLLGKPPNIVMSPFMALRREVVQTMLQIRTPYPFLDALILSVTHDIRPVKVCHQPRKYGRQTFTLRKRWSQLSNLVISNSSFLLGIVAWIGIGCSFLSLLYGGYVILRTLVFGSVIQGWASLMAVTLMIGGLVLFSLGVIGEYLIRIIKGIEGRPVYSIRRIADRASGPLVENEPPEAGSRKLQG